MRAQTLLGVLYWRGKGSVATMAWPSLWFTKAAAQESAGRSVTFEPAGCTRWAKGRRKTSRKPSGLHSFCRAWQCERQNISDAPITMVSAFAKDVVRARYWYEQGGCTGEFLGERRERTPSLIPPRP